MITLFYWLILIGVSLVIAHCRHWQNVTVTLAKKLPQTWKLPTLDPIDWLVRNGTSRKGSLYVVLISGFILFNIIFIRWYVAILSPVVLLFFVPLMGAFLPDENSKFFKTLILKKLRRVQSRYSRKGLPEPSNLKNTIDLVQRLPWPLVPEPPGIRGGLTYREEKQALKIQVYLVWYDDRFEHFSPEPSSFLVGVCSSKEDAEAYVARRPYHDSGNWDGYEYTGPYNLLEKYRMGFVSLEQVQDILKGQSPSRPNYY